MIIDDDIAQICHEANRVYCESIGDYSQSIWADAPNWQIDSAIQGVRYHRRNPESKPSDSHVNWLDGKARDGWTYGKIKNEEKKEHPCMLPYSELPDDQKTKDVLFVAIVRALA